MEKIKTIHGKFFVVPPALPLNISNDTFVWFDAIKILLNDVIRHQHHLFQPHKHRLVDMEFIIFL